MEYLGTIRTNPGDSVNNNTTQTPFSINGRYRFLIVVTPAPAAAIYRVRIGFESALQATNRDFAIGPSRTIQITCPIDANPDLLIVIAIRATGGAGDVDVYGTYGETGFL